MKGDHEPQEEARGLSGARRRSFWEPQEVDDGLLDGAPDPKILSPKLGSDLLARPIESISYVAGHLILGMTGVRTN